MRSVDDDYKLEDLSLIVRNNPFWLPRVLRIMPDGRTDLFATASMWTGLTTWAAAFGSRNAS